MSTIHGIIPALVTPMTSSQEVDYKKLASFTEHLVEKGIHGIRIDLKVVCE